MTEETKVVLRAAKVANIIIAMCQLFNLSTDEATEIYYKSTTSDLIEDGVSDLHCRSDKYLASLIWEEYQESL